PYNQHAIRYQRARSSHRGRSCEPADVRSVRGVLCPRAACHREGTRDRLFLTIVLGSRIVAFKRRQIAGRSTLSKGTLLTASGQEPEWLLSGAEDWDAGVCASWICFSRVTACWLPDRTNSAAAMRFSQFAHSA